MRVDGRANDELRPVVITPHFIAYPEGSVLIEMGNTRVICNASFEEGVPSWMRRGGSGAAVEGGWLTAEYSLLPRSTPVRTPREERFRGRAQEIRRFIGRSLRAAVDLTLLGEHTIVLDCDVIQADGGTRTAAVTGGYVALAIALHRLMRKGILPPGVLKTAVAAVSVGVVEGEALLDLCYEEDSRAEVDLNVVMTAEGRFVELQGTAEKKPFDRQMLSELLRLAEKGIRELLHIQEKALQALGE